MSLWLLEALWVEHGSMRLDTPAAGASARFHKALESGLRPRLKGASRQQWESLIRRGERSEEKGPGRSGG